MLLCTSFESWTRAGRLLENLQLDQMECEIEDQHTATMDVQEQD